MAAPVQDCIYLFGDSITQVSFEPGGFGQLLAAKYARQLDVLNRGYAGYNSNCIMPLLKQSIVKKEEQKYAPKIRLMTIWFGANDACPLPSPQHVPLETFKSNLSEAIDLIKSPSSEYYSPDTAIILFTPPPVNADQLKDLFGEHIDRFNKTTVLYAEAVKEVGTTKGVPVVDIYKTLWDLAGGEETKLRPYLWDGLHLNAEGYALAYEELMKTIASSFPHLHPDTLTPMSAVFPHWEEINREDFAGSILKRDIFAGSKL